MADYVLINGELYHHGVKGMKWGRRRWQNKDGSLTPAGEKRYNQDTAEGRRNLAKDKYKQANKEFNRSYDKAYNKSIAAYSPIKKHREANDRRWDDAWEKGKAAKAARKEYKEANKEYKAARKQGKEEFREARADISRSRSLGAKLATNVIAGPFANRTYNSVLASGGSRGEAMAVTAVSAFVAGPVGHLAVSALYTRDAGEKKSRK